MTRGWGNGWIGLGGLLASLTCGSADAVSVSSSSDADATQQHLERLRGRIESLRGQLESERAEQNALEAQLREVEIDIGALNRQLQDLERTVHESVLRLERDQVRKRGLHLDLDTHAQVLATQVRAAYAMGRQEYLKMLLNQEDPAVVGRMLAYYDYLNQARATRIELIRSHVSKIEEAARRIRHEQQEIEATRARIAAEKEALQARYQERAAVLAKLRRQISSEEQELLRYQEDARRLETLLAELQAASAAAQSRGQAFAELKGSLPWPIQGKLAAQFGSPRDAGQLRWQGVLIRAQEGVAVHAVSHGRVVFADWLRGFGLLVIIDHGDGYMSLYGHNQSLFKQTGDWVEAGEAVASVGRSGGQRYSGLYFEIRRKGRPTDPGKWLASRRNQ